MSTPEMLDWLAIAQTERHDLISELQRQLGLRPAQKNEAMRCAVTSFGPCAVPGMLMRMLAYCHA